MPKLKRSLSSWKMPPNLPLYPVELDKIDPDFTLALIEAIEQCLAPGSIVGTIRIADDALTALQVRLGEDYITLEAR